MRHFIMRGDPTRAYIGLATSNCFYRCKLTFNVESDCFRGEKASCSTRAPG